MKLSESITRLDEPLPPPPGPQGIEVSDNHVYFYADIDASTALTLIRRLREVDLALQHEKVTRNSMTPIWLHIYSGGGDLFASLGIADQIAQLHTPVFSVVEGYCASGATLISLACERRYILPNAFMLIHQLSGAAWGTYEQMKDDMHLSDIAMERVIAFYADKTGMKEKKVRKLLKRDSWFNAEECVELGLVHKILKGDE